MTAQPWPVAAVNDDTIHHGPFKFVRDDSGGCECWDVVLPDNLRLTHFRLKNYGGEPNNLSGFTGWRVVSGSPFTNAGGWSTRVDAIRGATPWLIDYYRKQAADKITEAAAAVIAAEAFLKATDKEITP